MRKLLLALFAIGGLTALASDARAHYPYGPRPYYYGSRYYAGPRVGYVGYSGYAPIYGVYGYYNYAPPVAYPVYPAPAYYYGYGSRGGISYVNPRVGVYVGF